MKNKMHGFKTVFSYNLGMHMKSKKYLAVTIILAVFLLAGLSIFIMIMGDKTGSDDQYTYSADKVYVIDETGLGVPDYSMYGAALGYEDAADTEFVKSDKSPEELVDNEGAQYVVVQKKSGDSFVLCVIFGNTDGAEDGQVDFNTSAMEEYLVPCFKTHLFQVSGLTEDQIVQVMLPVGINVSKIGGESEPQSRQAVAVIMILAFVMIIYFAVLIYGQQICADVPMEKTSKLVEQIMMSVTPYALVSGKILAMVTACVLQFIIWIGCIIGGILAGDVLSRTVLGVEDSVVTTILELLRGWFDGMGFSGASIVLAVLLFIAGLVFYLMLAGLAGSALARPEDASNVQGIFILPLVAAFMLVMFASGLTASGNYNISLAYNLVPFSAAMTAPGSVLIGELSIPMAIVSLLISVVSGIFILYVAARLYKGMMFFSGKKAKLKDFISAIKE